KAKVLVRLNISKNKRTLHCNVSLSNILNPVAGVIEGFHSVLLRIIPFPAQMLLVSILVSVIQFIIGVFYFKQPERSFADII
ncbi:hypothetical protein M1N10_02620, partial [Thermodesulfovibrionales bacterium]|nr:hypothetical protein [Thermodesulfovibrionales bacterium]